MDEKMKWIDDFFKDISQEELEKVLIENGLGHICHSSEGYEEYECDEDSKEKDIDKDHKKCYDCMDGEYELNPEELQLDTFFCKNRNRDLDTFYALEKICFVKVTHMPSGISVTNFDKSQVEAKRQCIGQLKILVKEWEREV